MNCFWHECSTNNENFDTPEFWGETILSMLGEDGEDGGSRWCQVISLFETSVPLKRIPTRLLLVQALLQKAKATSASLHATTLKASAVLSGRLSLQGHQDSQAVSTAPSSPRLTLVAFRLPSDL